jgi:ubiquinone/menaquinone biosynthesis C-methylase UbiE
MINRQITHFYDDIADYYDQMISFEKRLPIEEAKFMNLIEKYSVSTALDAGAGSGFHSVLLAKCGVRVTAVDLSGKMLRKLEHNAKRHKVKIETIKSDFYKLRLPPSSFDAIFSLGNTLAHLPSPEHLRNSVTTFARLLKPGGVLILQLLNYDRIIGQKERLQSIKKDDGNLYIRYYELHDNQIIFNLLKINIADLTHNLNSITIRPILSSELMKILCKSGFEKPSFYSDLTCKPFLKRTSQDLVVIAKKTN